MKESEKSHLQQYTVVSTVKLHWLLEIFLTSIHIEAKTVQIEYIVIALSGNCKFENDLLELDMELNRICSDIV